jgi:hypothetical protein
MPALASFASAARVQLQSTPTCSCS